MRSWSTHSVKPSPWLHLGFVGALILTLSGWTCTAIVGFQTCLGVPASPQIASLSPATISATAASVSLTVSGSNFISQSQILWNGNALPTTFIDSQHLRVSITQQTLAQFGGSFGSNVLISVNTPPVSPGCPLSGSSSTLILTVH